jgi:hypothetical protein
MLEESTTRCVGKFPDCYCCNCLGERRWEGRPLSHFQEPIASVCHVTPHCEHALFYMSALSILHSVLSAMNGKIKHRVCIIFCLKLEKFPTRTIEMLHKAFGERSLSWIVVFDWHSCFKADQVSVEDDECSRWPSTSRMTENVEKFKNSSTNTSPNNAWARRHYSDQLRRLPEDHNRKFEHTPHCSFIMTTLPPTRPWKQQTLWLRTWLSIPILLISWAWPPVISLCFPNWKWSWRDDVLKQCLMSQGSRKWYLTALRKMTSTVLFKCEEIMGSLYTFPMRLFWRRWQPKLN